MATATIEKNAVHVVNCWPPCTPKIGKMNRDGEDDYDDDDDDIELLLDVNNSRHTVTMTTDIIVRMAKNCHSFRQLLFSNTMTNKKHHHFHK